GREKGYCLMIGGEQAAVARLAPVFAALSPGGGADAPTAPQGWLHAGPNGAGHFVKMVHNGIEYSLMQAYAEGFELLYKHEYGLDVERIANLWGQGSVVRSSHVSARAATATTPLGCSRPFATSSAVTRSRRPPGSDRAARRAARRGQP